MDNKELRQFIKSKFQALGFQSRKSYLYKIFDDDYLIGFYLDPSSYCKGYRFTCGIIYLPDELKMPFEGRFDLMWNYMFPMEPGEQLDIHECLEKKRYQRIFEYELYTLDQLDQILEENYQFYIVPLLNKEYGLNHFRRNWKSMNRFSNRNIIKICNRAGLNSDDVLAYLGRCSKAD